jgi:5-methyltetrahydrofolate--homocysteine methyltransferase
MRVIARRDQPLEPPQPVPPVSTIRDRYLDAPHRCASYRNFCRTHRFCADAFPNLSMDIGPGSMALYLGSEPIFREDTVWFGECVTQGWEAWGPIRYDPQNRWWRRHLAMIEEARKLAGDDFLVNIPDIIENLDIMSAMRGPQAMCFDLIDEPEVVHRRLDEIDALYFAYYDAMYERTKDAAGGVSFTAFNLWGPGRTAKIQCDFCALMSPDQFQEFVVPSLRKQCAGLDTSVYHLDGPDAVKHVEALMEIEELDALQWTCGAGQPDGGHEGWFPIYDSAKAAGKSLWIALSDGGIEGCIESADRIVRRYGSDGLYLLFQPVVSETEAEELIRRAETRWG